MDLCMMSNRDQENLNMSFFSLPKDDSCLLYMNGDVNIPDTVRQDFRCVGSSHGWLAFTHNNSDKPFLHNPFSNTTIALPSVHTLPGSDRSMIDKLVLCGDPSHHDNYTVLAMHSAWIQTRIAFCRPGDDKWTDLGSEILKCQDIACCDVTRSAFALGPGPTVEVWDLSGAVPSKKTMIQGPQLPPDNEDTFPGDLYTSQCYLALSEFGQMFLAVRYIGEFVRYDGAVVYEEDTLTDYASEPLVCPYKTVAFHVFKYDHIADGKWVQVQSLDDCTFFLGGNQSTMMKTRNEELKRNAIYFTDGYWERMEEDYSYGGHDTGIFDMADGSIRPFLESEELRIVPPPMWISVSPRV